MLVLLIANLIILPIFISFFLENLEYQAICFNCVSDTIFLLDIIVNFRTGTEFALKYFLKWNAFKIFQIIFQLGKYVWISASKRNEITYSLCFIINAGIISNFTTFFSLIIGRMKIPLYSPNGPL